MEKNKKFIISLWVYIVLFYAFWASYTLLLVPFFRQVFVSEWTNEIIDAVIKNLTWTLPALLLAGIFRNELFSGLKEMYTFKKSDAKYLLLLIPITAVVIGGQLIKKHGLSISPNFKYASIISVVFVGIMEESVFRGLFLNAALKNADTKAKTVLAVAVNSLAFLVIHFPIWLIDGVFIFSFTSLSFITIILLSIVFSYCFIKTKSLWVSIIIHSLYDLLVILLV